MPVTDDIVQSWWRPRVVIRRHMKRGVSEAWAFSLLVAFLVLVFIAQAPGLARAAVAQPEVPLVQRLVAMGLALIATIPAWYLVAAVSHLVARAMGGRGGYYGARLALFWALLTVIPGMLLQGMVAGFIGPGAQLQVLAAVVAVAFFWIWLSMLIEVER